jgi:hypothetical protein
MIEAIGGRKVLAVIVMLVLGVGSRCEVAPCL